MTEENRDLSGQPVQQPKLEYEFTWRQAFRQFLDERPEVLGQPAVLALVELAFINGWCSHDAWAISVGMHR